jgi:hypothetical protein
MQDFLKVAPVDNHIVLQLTFGLLRGWFAQMGFLKIAKLVGIYKNWYKSTSSGGHEMGNRVS